MNLKEQAAILAAAIEGKTLKVRRKGDDKTWTAVFACPNAEVLGPALWTRIEVPE